MANEEIAASCRTGTGRGPAPPRTSSCWQPWRRWRILTCFAIGAGGLFGMQMLSGRPRGQAARGSSAAGAEDAHSAAASLKPLPSDRDQSGRLEGHVDPDRGVGCLCRRRRGRVERTCLQRSPKIIAYLRTGPLGQNRGPERLPAPARGPRRSRPYSQRGQSPRVGVPGTGARMIRVVGALIFLSCSRPRQPQPRCRAWNCSSLPAMQVPPAASSS